CSRFLVPQPPRPPLFPYTTLFRSLAVHTRGVPLADDVDLAALAAKTPGLVGAELRNLVNEAALAAARRDAQAVARQDFEDALERSEEHTSELQSRENLVCRLLLEK